MNTTPTNTNDQNCPNCNSLLEYAIAHTAKNNGRTFQRCNNNACNYFRWVNQTSVNAPAARQYVDRDDHTQQTNPNDDEEVIRRQEQEEDIQEIKDMCNKTLAIVGRMEQNKIEKVRAQKRQKKQETTAQPKPIDSITQTNKDKDDDDEV